MKKIELEANNFVKTKSTSLILGLTKKCVI